MTRKTRIITPSLALAIAATGLVARGGDLNPPAGPVAPTMKTLAEVEPRTPINATTTPGDAVATFIISQPGSYYLTGNITGEVGKDGIRVDANKVSIDLNGFTLTGVPGSRLGIDASDSRGSQFSNGMLDDWSLIGIWIGHESRVSDLTVRNSGSTGISTLNNCIVTRCLVRTAGGYGIHVGVGSVVSECQSVSATLNGIFAEFTSVIVDSVATNGLSDGFVLNNSGTIARCAATFNQGDGIQVAANTIVRDNICSGNGFSTGDGAGIHVTSGDNRIEGNNCVGADRGIDVDVAGNIIIRNTCSGNSPLNWDIAANNKCLVVNGVNAGAISGDSGGVGPGSTDPNANFTY